jgi:hypothetical protein
MFQMRDPSFSDFLPDRWITSASLGLSLDLAHEWDSYCSNLTQSGIQLTNSSDQIQWMGGDRSGRIFVHNLYAAISNSIWHTNFRGWRNQKWTWCIPSKIKFFTWLLIEYKLNTWDNILKKGWLGPNFCHLWKSDSKSTNHLFINFPFTRQVWGKIILILKFQTIWDGISLPICFERWAQKEKKLMHLPSLICWATWLERNNTIFENGIPSVSAIAYRALGIYNAWNVAHANKTLKHHSLKVPTLEGTHFGWFDGAAHTDGTQRGVVGVIKTTQNTFYNWTFNCGPGTNTRAELLGAWATLFLASRLHIEDL